MSRRRLLRGALVTAAAGAGGGAVAVATGLASPRRILQDLTGACGEAAPPPPRSTYSIESGELVSAAVGGSPAWRIARPGGAGPDEALPLCLCLHRRGGTSATPFDEVRFHDYVAAATADDTGARIALAAIDGGDRYWHERADGADSLALLTDEFLPFCRDEHGLGADGRPVAVVGWSMGGFGALVLAERIPTVAAVVAVSPAISPDRSGYAGDAFDGPDDFAAVDPFAHAAALAGRPVRLSTGESDPSVAATRAFAATVDGAQLDVTVGCHDADFWRRSAPADARFLAAALR